MKNSPLYDISKKVVEIAMKNNLTIATAESFTGGNISKSITDIAGSSNVLVMGFVTYMIKAKINILGVQEKTIDKYGVVSKEVVNEMSKQCMLRTSADITISSTGFAGPNDKEKNGYCFLGLRYKSKDGIKAIYKNFKFDGSRTDVREQATYVALKKVYELINGGLKWLKNKRHLKKL